MSKYPSLPEVNIFEGILTVCRKLRAERGMTQVTRGRGWSAEFARVREEEALEMNRKKPRGNKKSPNEGADCRCNLMVYIIGSRLMSGLKPKQTRALILHLTPQ